jgi:hypothetical protein
MSRDELQESFQEWGDDPLTRTFNGFHRLLDLQLSECMKADPVQSIVFSDSAFVAFNDGGVASYFAGRLMRDLIGFGIPARMGVGTGSFRGLRLTTDISDEVRRHSSQFLGSGVVRANRAEGCGLKGMRILMHPDAQMIPGFSCELVSVEGSACFEGRNPAVIHEFNYLHLSPPWIEPGEGEPTHEERYQALVASVKVMMERVHSDYKIHYTETLAALARMKAAAGQ